MKQEGLFMAIMHEIKNTTATMNGFLQLLEKRVPQDSCVQRYIEILFHELGCLERLIKEGFYFCRTEGLSFCPCDLTEILKDAGERAKAIAGGKGIRVEIKADPCPPVEGVPELLRQLLWNLVENALAALPKFGVLALELTVAADGWVQLSCRDTGVGIAPADLAQIFRCDFTTKTDGKGLGLPLCKRIASLHGGRLNVESNPDTGTSFTLLLPVPEDCLID